MYEKDLYESMFMYDVTLYGVVRSFIIEMRRAVLNVSGCALMRPAAPKCGHGSFWKLLRASEPIFLYELIGSEEGDHFKSK